jgi:prepilin-type N-terminal cleavage/methylation domain-containing protein
MRYRRSLQTRSGFTLIELMVVVAVVAVVLMLAAPSFRDLIETRRIIGTSDQFITDVQFTRTEATSRQESTGLTFRRTSGVRTCYTIHSCSTVASATCACNCLLEVGSRCVAPVREIRTVELAHNDGVALVPVVGDGTTPTPETSPISVIFDPSTGGISTLMPIFITVGIPTPNQDYWFKVAKTRSGTFASIRTVINRSGRPTTCAQGGAVTGVKPC